MTTPWRRVPTDLATAMRPRLPDAVPAIADAVTAANPALADTSKAKFDSDLRTAVQVAIERFLDLAGTDEPALPPRIREVFVALGAAEARENRGPELLLGALRTAARLLLRTASQALAESRPVTVDEIIDLSDATSAFVDELASACTDGLARQLREQAGEGDRRRRRAADLLLRGGAPADVAREAVIAIGWPVLDRVVPVLLPPEQARDARFRFAADGVVAERARDAVLLLRSGPRAERPALAEALDGRGAVIGPALSWTEVPEAVRLAERAAELIGTGPAPVFVEDHFAALALRGEPGALAALAARRLAPLDGLRPAQREQLLTTLESWLRHWGSRTAVAAELYVHPQTVSYRVNRLRDLLGPALDDPAARFELLLVLSQHSSATGAR
ncbi:helix-turn-helix domain-containing protein [Actinoplanes oblitus]|uniref:Helix-turn-helix domain-containing protein n=1 Tax=Actinoplanes oblitus TaxID=3040509 RepID=A0ABY8WNG0_9ACTN|nr:PucR family transcriptional regulator [Actinoplanes oblitus]WIM98566.1 helix-turn-helix domain-containing protein [Actinoplanes oblitus]